MAQDGSPPRGRGQLFLAWLGAGVSVLYLVNPGFGVFELLPDNIPGLGNLDEAAATALLIACIRAIVRKRRDVLDVQASAPVQPSASNPAARAADPPRRS
jgi:uncharacterized membrane protein YkvA (DUF1232 family)